MKNTNLLIGKISSGKTLGYMFNVVEEKIKNNENLLILDNKNEYYKRFKNELNNAGYNTLVFNLDNTSKSNGFNPLLLPYSYYKKGNKDKAIELISEIALEIFRSDNKEVDPYWEETSANYFTAMSLILFKEGTEEEINLGSVLAMINLGEQKVGDVSVIRKYFDKLNILDSIYIAGSPTIYSPPETRGSIMSVVKQKLNKYCAKEQLLNNLCNNDINIESINSKTAIIIIGNKNINKLSNILIDQIVNYSLDNNIDFNYILDNFQDMPKLLELNKILDRKLKLFIVVRNLEQLQAKYDKYIDSNFENVIDTFTPEFNNANLEDVSYPQATMKEIKYFNIKEFIEHEII
ncbi:MAG: hypothetical protein E7160_01845 [Firmicutes bacterium]|nr:hypothetical protein [Bacillota bacterium]